MIEKICKLLFEAGTLKLIPRAGWLKIGIKNPESVAEHSFRVALISFFLSLLEGFSFSKSCEIAFLGLIHDLHETRTLDLHKLSKKYVKFNSNEIITEQLNLFPETARNEILELKKDRRIRDIVEDADKIELYLQAREYMESNPSAKLYLENLNFKTKSSVKLMKMLKKMDYRWWKEFE